MEMKARFVYAIQTTFIGMLAVTLFACAVLAMVAIRQTAIAVWDHWSRVVVGSLFIIVPIMFFWVIGFFVRKELVPDLREIGVRGVLMKLWNE